MTREDIAAGTIASNWLQEENNMSDIMTNQITTIPFKTLVNLNLLECFFPLFMKPNHVGLSVKCLGVGGGQVNPSMVVFKRRSVYVIA